MNATKEDLENSASVTHHFRKQIYQNARGLTPQMSSLVVAEVNVFVENVFVDQSREGDFMGSFVNAMTSLALKIKANCVEVPNMEFVAVVNVYVKTSIMGMYAT